MQKSFHTHAHHCRYINSTTLGETVRAFVPHPLPPRQPELAADGHQGLNAAAEQALGRLAAVAGLVPSVGAGPAQGPRRSACEREVVV